MTWIRIDASLPTHRKSIELGEELRSPTAWAHLVQLWGWAAANATGGTIKGRAPERVIEVAAGWRGKKGRFVTAAINAGFIDVVIAGQEYALHDWQEHNGKALQRADDAAKRMRDHREALRDAKESAESTANRDEPVREQFANRARTGGARSVERDETKTERNETFDATAKTLTTEASTETVREESANGSQPEPVTVGELAANGSRTRGERPTPARPLELALDAPRNPSAAQRVYEHWRKLYAPRASATLDPKRERRILDRLKEGRTPEELCRSLDGWKRDTWVDRPKHSGIDQLLRDASQVDKGLEWGAGIASKRDPARGFAQPSDIPVEQGGAIDFAAVLPPLTPDARGAA